MRADEAVRASALLSSLVVLQLAVACAPAPIPVDPPVSVADLDEIEDS